MKLNELLKGIEYIEDRFDETAIKDRLEMIYEEDIPPKVSIAEGVEIAKVFSTDESSGFVNGILDSVYKSKKFKWINDKPKDWQCFNTDLIKTKYYQKAF